MFSQHRQAAFIIYIEQTQGLEDIENLSIELEIEEIKFYEK